MSFCNISMVRTKMVKCKYANRKPRHDVLFDIITMIALSLTIYKIFGNQIKLQKFNLEKEGHGQEEKWNLHHSTVYW